MGRQKKILDLIPGSVPQWSVNECTDFEDDIINLIKNIEFRSMNWKFQSMLSPDIKK